MDQVHGENREKTVVSLAPAYLGVFGDADPNQMAAALHQLGFTYVHETAEAAGYVVQEYMNYCDRSDKDAVLLTSSCSAITTCWRNIIRYAAVSSACCDTGYRTCKNAQSTVWTGCEDHLYQSMCLRWRRCIEGSENKRHHRCGVGFCNTA